MQTANTASLLVKSSLASAGTVTVQLATPAQYCDATCIRCLTLSGTVGSSITQALSSMHCSVVKNFCGSNEFPAFAYSLVVATWLSSSCGGYRDYGRAASYSPGRPWSLDGARCAREQG
jgi:hypothetical protein